MLLLPMLRQLRDHHGVPDRGVVDAYDHHDGRYGDRYPVTGEGRLVAATLMVGGVALLGVVTGLVASWLLRTLSGAEEAAGARTAAAVSELRAELAELCCELSERHEAPPLVRHSVT